MVLENHKATIRGPYTASPLEGATPGGTSITVTAQALSNNCWCRWSWWQQDPPICTTKVLITEVMTSTFSSITSAGG